jgi:hypothetical protein
MKSGLWNTKQKIPENYANIQVTSAVSYQCPVFTRRYLVLCTCSAVVAAETSFMKWPCLCVTYFVSTLLGRGVILCLLEVQAN